MDQNRKPKGTPAGGQFAADAKTESGQALDTESAEPTPDLPLATYRHPNGGGWVTETATVAPSALIGEGSLVREGAHIGTGATLAAATRIGTLQSVRWR